MGSMIYSSPGFMLDLWWCYNFPIDIDGCSVSMSICLRVHTLGKLVKMVRWTSRWSLQHQPNVTAEPSKDKVASVYQVSNTGNLSHFFCPCKSFLRKRRSENQHDFSGQKPATQRAKSAEYGSIHRWGRRTNCRRLTIWFGIAMEIHHVSCVTHLRWKKKKLFNHWRVI